jgi:hypothetical protein
VNTIVETVSTTPTISTGITAKVTWMNHDRAKTFALRYGTHQNCSHLKTITQVASRQDGVFREGDRLICTGCAEKENMV